MRSVAIETEATGSWWDCSAMSEKPKDLDQAYSGLVADEHLRQFIVQTTAAIREGHELAAASQVRSDREFVWFIGLMGGGIFSVHQLFTQIPPNVLLWCLVPWAVGIISGVTSRVLSGELQNRNNLIFYDRVSRLGLLLLVNDYSLIRKELADVLKPQGSLQRRESRLRYLLWAVNTLYYLSYVGFLVGALAAAWIAYATRVA
jgi:hypothetical protein